MDRRNARRIVVVASAIGVAALAALVVALVGIAATDVAPTLRADPVEPPRDAPATRGRDQDGRPVAVPAPGRPALVTFLFAECPDVCPLAAQEISQALDRVGADADEIDVVAVSVDPAGDTPAAVRGFLRTHRLDGRMRYLIGSEAQLAPIWKAWLVSAQTSGEARSTHSARIVLIDRDGRQAGAYSAGIPIAIDDLAADIRTLIDG
jgi:protein SCO1/2